jgi:hypothetical protein
VGWDGVACAFARGGQRLLLGREQASDESCYPGAECVVCQRYWWVGVGVEGGGGVGWGGCLGRGGEKGVRNDIGSKVWNLWMEAGGAALTLGTTTGTNKKGEVSVL